MRIANPRSGKRRSTPLRISLPMSKPRILFVCARNQWRSPTAEATYRKDPRIDVRSAGLSSKSAHRLSGRDLEWADLVLVMEDEHKRRITRGFRGGLELPPIESLEIPDEYRKMDPELVALIRGGTEAVLRREFGIEPNGT